MLRFNGVIMAANVAWDPARRVSAHAIFARVEYTSLPFTFPAPFYIIANLVGLEPGTHMVQVDQAGAWAISGEATEFETDEEGGAMVVIRAEISVVHEAGNHPLHLRVDGVEHNTGVTLQMHVMEQARLEEEV